MKKYISPELNVEYFESNDILTVSTEGDENNGKLDLKDDSDSGFGPWF